MMRSRASNARGTARELYQQRESIIPDELRLVGMELCHELHRECEVLKDDFTPRSMTKQPPRLPEGEAKHRRERRKAIRGARHLATRARGISSRARKARRPIETQARNLSQNGHGQV